MKNTYFNPKLISLRKISVQLFSTLPKPNNLDFYLYEDCLHPLKLKIVKQVAAPGVYIFDLELPFDYRFGHRCSIGCPAFGLTKVVDVSDAIDFDEFDSLFAYTNDDLGANYSKDETTFVLWAPLANEVVLKLENNNKEFDLYQMKRENRGVYRLTVKGDLLNHRYHYIVNNSGTTLESNDPFGKGAYLNSEYSAVVDVDAIRNRPRIKPKTIINNYTDASIYEVHIRDISEHRSSNIKNKGKYLGLAETKRRTYANHPAGLDYIKTMGFSHVQLQPILDFEGNDNPNINKDYNWGYDPISFFALEGSYSLHPEIAQCRLEEFRTLVDTLHQNDIRVNVDVVYNHLYDYITTSFEKCVPGYFFRRRNNGLLAMASGCGNDFASEKFMGRRAIVLSVKHLFDVFDIDGLRFDLMGLIDIDTIKEVTNVARFYKKDAMIYGEGWNMGNELPFEKKACTENASKLPDVAFFNESFRDIIKGPTFDLDIKGFAGGDFNYVLGYEFAFMGSAVDYCYPKRFNSSNQSINYVECHDNHVIFDKFVCSNNDEDKEYLYYRIKLANALTILSFGVPLIHMGQEIGKSKFGLGNTYITPNVNAIDYREVDERYSMVEQISTLIHLRNNELSFFKKINNPKDIESMFEFENTENNLCVIKLKKDCPIDVGYEDLIFLINVDKVSHHFNFPTYYYLLSPNKNKSEEIYVQSTRVPPRTFSVFVIDKK